MKLYGTPPTRALRAVWLINELDLECEVVPVDLRGGEHLTPEFLRLNPAGKVPVLVDDEVVITESAAIPLYLAEKCPEKGLIPQRLEDRAQVYRWLFFLVSEIEAPLWRMARNTDIYPESDRQTTDIALALAEGKDMCAVLEKHLTGRSYIVGDQLTVVDMVAAYTLDWAQEVGMLDGAPRLRAFVETMYARPKAPLTIKEAFARLES